MKIIETDGKGLMELLSQLGGVKKEPKLGEPKPLNEEAMAEQKRHSQAIDAIMEEAQTAIMAVQMAKSKLEREQARWVRNMGRAMPELVADNSDFKISEDGRTFRRVLSEEAPSTATPPEWVQEMIMQMGKDESDATH